MSTAPRPKWLPSTGPGNLNVPPEKWGMTLRQWAAFIMTCACCMETWEELEASEERKASGYVNLYQICDHYVKPWTRNTGNSVALLMNHAEPLKAMMMISHAWGECMRESLVAVLGKSTVMGVSLDTVIWFCTFAQYQPGDMEGDCGPGVAAQLAMDPFKCVIQSKPPFGMLVIHTSRAELYGRLWCVYEVNEAEDSGIQTSASMSVRYLMETFKEMQEEDELRVTTETADCWSPDDAEMIRGKIVEAGGFDPLNEKIFQFRCSSFKRSLQMFQEFVEWFEKKDGADSDESLEFIAEAIRNAATFVGLHCLAPLALAAEDEDTCQVILLVTKILIQHFLGAGFQLPEGCPPPPRFDPKWILDPSQAPDVDDDEVVMASLEQLKVGTFGGMMVGMLEMGAGGSEKSAVVQEVGYDESDEDSIEAVKAAFARWDDDGSGTITKEELGLVLMKLNPDFTQQDVDTMFNSADTNQDGTIDYREFVDWLGQEFG